MAQRDATTESDSVGLRILLARTRRRWTLRDLRKATDIPESALSRYERDLVAVPSDRLGKIAEALGTTPNDLLGFGNRSTLDELGLLEAAAVA